VEGEKIPIGEWCSFGKLETPSDYKYATVPAEDLFS